MGAWIKGSNKAEKSETASNFGSSRARKKGWIFLSRKNSEKLCKTLLPYVNDKLHWENGELYLELILSYLVVDDGYSRKKPWPGTDAEIISEEISNHPNNWKSPSRYDYLFKMILVGDSGVGKSSLLTRFVDEVFYDSFIATIGVDFKITTLYSLEDLRFKIQLWDTAGPERFRTITRAYYRGAHGMVIVYDMSLRSTFENVDNWFQNCFEYSEEKKPMILLANKSDERREVSVEEGKEKAKKHGAMFMEVSAKTGENVEEAFGRFTDTIYHFIFEQTKPCG